MAGSRPMGWREMVDLLTKYGIPTPPDALVRGEEEAAAAALEMGLPVAMKLLAPGLPHKSDVGGVILGLGTEGDVREGYRRIAGVAESLGLDGEVLVQRMEPPGREVIVGLTRDPNFGPVVMFGLGGIFVEVLRDVAFRVAPIDLEEAMAMMRETKGAKVLEGFRGEPSDMKAVARVIEGVSRLGAEREEVLELDINPLLVHREGAVALDFRALVRA